MRNSSCPSLHSNFEVDAGQRIPLTWYATVLRILEAPVFFFSFLDFFDFLADFSSADSIRGQHLLIETVSCMSGYELTEKNHISGMQTLFREDDKHALTAPLT